MIARKKKVKARVSLVDLMKEYRLERDLSRGYVVQIEVVLRHLREWNRGPVYADDLNDTFVNRWLEHEQKKGIRTETLVNRRAMVLMFWRAAYDREYLDFLPRRVRKIRRDIIIPQAWTREEVMRLIEGTDDICKWSIHVTAKCHTRLFWRAIIQVAWDTGLRRIDIERLKRSDIGDDGTIHIVQHKTGWPLRCHVQPETIAAIDATNPLNRELIFGAGSASRSRTFKRLVKAAGLKGSFKTLRKSSATAVERLQPGAASQHLGHKTPGMAAKHYIDPRMVQATKLKPPALASLAAAAFAEGGVG